MIIPWAKLGIYAATAALLCALGAGITYKALAGKIAQQSATISALEKQAQTLAKQRATDQKVLKKRAIALAAAEQAAADARSALASALTANREWADTPVPQEVQDALTRP